MRQTSYKLHGHTLDNVEASKYLGITNNNLSCDRHIDNRNKTLGFIRRNLKDGTKPVLSQQHNTAIVRPTVEYEITIWHPVKKMYDST